MDADDLMRHHSWPHEVVEVHPHSTPEIGCVQSLEASELFIPEIDLAVQALNSIIGEQVIFAFMHKLRCCEVCHYMFGGTTKYFFACFDI